MLAATCVTGRRCCCGVQQRSHPLLLLQRLSSSSLFSTVVVVGKNETIQRPLHHHQQLQLRQFHYDHSIGWSQQQLLQLRMFSSGDDDDTTKGGGSSSDNKGGDDNNANNNKKVDDPFGVHYDDGSGPGKLGPQSNLPPKYKRDPATGLFTGEIEVEAQEDDMKWFQLTPPQKEAMVKERLEQQIQQKSPRDIMGDPMHLAEVARRIREESTALNPLGRDVAGLERVQQRMANQKKEDETAAAAAMAERDYHMKDAASDDVEDDDDDDSGFQDETGLSVPLSKTEFRAFQAYLRKEHKAAVSPEDVSVDSSSSSQQQQQQHRRRDMSEDDREYDDLDWDLKWLQAGAQRDMDDPPGIDPVFDMAPHEFSPRAMVNRRKAKPIPKELLSHLNISFLSRFLTPSGQILSRTLSRLGARDQRKIARLIKRARNLGLIPHHGRFKIEDHGNIYAKDIDEERPWEQELIRRGLVRRGAWKTKTLSSDDDDMDEEQKQEQALAEQLAEYGVVIPDVWNMDPSELLAPTTKKDEE